jgi:hypothetical protein
MKNKLENLNEENSSLQAFLEMDTGYLTKEYFDQKNKKLKNELNKDYGYLSPQEFVD